MNAAKALVVTVGVGLVALAGCGPDRTGKADGAPASARSSATLAPAASPSGANGSTMPGTPAPSTPAPTASPHHPAPTDSTAAKTVTVWANGGFVGRSDRLTVRPDGSWHFTDSRGTDKSGRLTAGRRDRLAQLVTSPKLAAEARSRPEKKTTTCNDGISYRLHVGEVTVNRGGCGGSADMPTFNAVLSLLSQATPL